MKRGVSPMILEVITAYMRLMHCRYVAEDGKNDEIDVNVDETKSEVEIALGEHDHHESENEENSGDKDSPIDQIIPHLINNKFSPSKRLFLILHRPRI